MPISKQVDGTTVELHKLDTLTDTNDIANIFKSSEYLIVVFPLYTYSMPAPVKQFFEDLEPYCGTCQDKKVGFIMQYGFPKETHARPLEKYLEHLCTHLGCHYLGTIIKGCCDALTSTPEKFGKTLQGIREIRRQFATTDQINKTSLFAFSRPENQGILLKLMMRLLVHFINKFYWGDRA